MANLQSITTRRIGIAIGTDRMSALVGNRAATLATIAWAYPEEPEDLEHALSNAFFALGEKLGKSVGRPVTGATITVALLPPLSHARMVQLPPLGRADAELVLQRDASRYFPGGSGPRALAARVPARGKRGAAVSEQTLAVAASATLIETIRTAAATNGWRLGTVAPAVSAWEGAIAVMRGAKPAALVAVLNDTAHVYALTKGKVTNVRRVAADATEIAGALAGSGGSVLLLADAEDRESLKRELSAAGLQVVALDEDAAGVAAGFADIGDLHLLSPALVLERSARQRTRATGWIAAAAVLLLLAAAMEFWGWERELVAVRDQRNAIRNQVNPLLAARDSLNLLEQRLAHVNEVSGSVPRWTGALFDIAMLLPSETHVTSLRATGDTLIVEAEGGVAGEAIEALREAPNLQDVRLRGNVVRELDEGTTAGENFTLFARLRLPKEAAPKPVKAAAASSARSTPKAGKPPTRGEL